ncbi:hypothetical protein ACIHAX_37320 [Nocardia sp. NPDC051929]|uniref:hypothetical protein n=1 Tax=unclassified Nocardia TaxID=2637762 RepID=UPI00341EB190
MADLDRAVVAADAERPQVTHNTASTTSNTACARRGRHRYNSSRNADSSPTAPTQPVSCTLLTEALGHRKSHCRSEKAVPAELAVYPVCGNLATHKTPIVNEWLARHTRFHVHFTPTGSSWLHRAERWFGHPTDLLTRRGVHKSVAALEKDVMDWITHWNAPVGSPGRRQPKRSATPSPDISNEFRGAEH